jgi:ribosomal protein S10
MIDLQNTTQKTMIDLQNTTQKTMIDLQNTTQKTMIDLQNKTEKTIQLIMLQKLSITVTHIIKVNKEHHSFTVMFSIYMVGPEPLPHKNKTRCSGRSASCVRFIMKRRLKQRDF